MLANKILTCFQRNPQLRILFFFDKEGENLEELRQMQLTGIRVVEFDGRWFYWKIQLNKELQEKIVFYFKQAAPETQDELLNFPLLELLKANRELRLDDIAEFMDTFNLQPHQLTLVNRYLAELSKPKVQQALMPVLNAAEFDEKSVQQGLISVFLGSGKIEDRTMILVRLLLYAHPDKQKELPRFFARILKNNLLDTLNKYIRQTFDTTIEGQDKDEIIGLVQRLKYNAITQRLTDIPADSYRSLKIKDTTCLNCLNQLIEAGLKHTAFKETLHIQGGSIRADKIVTAYGFDMDYIYMPDDLAWALILALMDNPGEQADKRLKTLFTQIREEGVIRSVLTFLYHVSVMNKQIKETGNLLWDTPDDYIAQYTRSLYPIDYNYRKAVFEYHQADMQSTPVEAQLNEIKQKLDKTYYEFSFKLNDGWLKCLNAYNFEYKNIGCDKQYDFFTNHIRPLPHKRAIIISDALRYETASELVGELHKDDKNVSALHFQLASIPSLTNVGMAHLLPGKTYAYLEDEILIDGEKTTTAEQREKILQKHAPKSRIVHYETIIRSDKQQNRELFKSDIVYIYHNVIDNEGHRGTERNTFKAVQTAIEELTRLVKLILGGFGVSKVIITADHGFLYNDMEISENDKNEIHDTEIIKSDARHYITTHHLPVASGYKIPLFRTSRFQEPYHVVIPDAVNRFRKQGSRYMFTHGGGSLQELIVPVIESTRQEERIRQKVKPALLDKNLSIVSNSLRFNIIQETAVSSTEKERKLLIGIYDNDKLVSNQFRLTLDATGRLPSERVSQVNLVLTAKTTGSVLKLRVLDEDEKLNPLIEENVKNNTLIERDF